MTTTRRAFTTLAALAPATTANASPRHRRLIAHDDFRHGLRQWAVELAKGGTAAACRGTLEVDVPAGATIWFRERLRASKSPALAGQHHSPLIRTGTNPLVNS
ncbi:hypothetical protein [Streptomyces scabiei]|uniref:Uncharacterized protein n=1 Tax=Streptomyces scabiei TaxID=1930 RepID=A0A117EF97_STRSC|nr:hypothetical protein SsS58_05757 [Streptomyces scabiei]